MVGGPSIVFDRYHEVEKTKIRFTSKDCRRIVGYDANSLYLYFSGLEMPCGKEKYMEIEDPYDETMIKRTCDRILSGRLFGFLQVDIEVPEHLMDTFSEFSPLFAVDKIPEEVTPQHMKDYCIKTGRKEPPKK